MNFLKTRNCKLKTSSWFHSEIQYVAYFHSYKLHKTFVEEGGMNEAVNP